MRRFATIVLFGLLITTGSATAATPRLSQTAYLAITRMQALVEDFDPPDAHAGAALRRAVCDRLPTSGNDRQAKLVLADCAAAADAIGPITTAMQCTTPACVRAPAAEAVKAIRRSHRAEAALAVTVMGPCRAVLASDARHTGRIASAWRHILRAARAGSQRGVVRGIFAFVDASLAGERFARRLPTCAP
jgi:hypothetical protein